LAHGVRLQGRIPSNIIGSHDRSIEILANHDAVKLDEVVFTVAHLHVLLILVGFGSIEGARDLLQLRLLLLALDEVVAQLCRFCD